MLFQVPIIDDESKAGVGDEVKIESSEATHGADVETAAENRPREVPQPSTNGQRIYDIDPMLRGFKHHLEYRYVVLLLCTLRHSSVS
jgi:1,4-alpha-glucan branching enzyme